MCSMHSKMRAMALMAVIFATALVAAKGATSDFPFLECNPPPSAYSMAPTVKSVGNNTYCFTLQVSVPLGCTKYCCRADLKKIEFNVNEECRSGTVKATVDGVPTKVGPAYAEPSNSPPGSMILRLTQLGLNTTNDGAEICVTLLPNKEGGGCLTLEQLCKPPAGMPDGVCSLAMIDTQHDCCPVSNTQPGSDTPMAYVSPPPPPPPVSDTPCKACVNLDLIPKYNHVLFPYGWSDEQCESLSTMIINDVTAEADRAGAAMLGSPPVVTCTASKIQVCFTFASDEEGAKLQEWMDNAVNYWFSAAFPNFCKPYVMQYTLVVYVAGEDGAPSCINSGVSLHCDPPFNIDFPKCECDTSKYATPFIASPYLDSLPGRTNRTKLYCFTVAVVSPFDPTSACGSTTTILKAEIFADDAMRIKVKYIGLQPTGESTMHFQATSWGPLGDDTLKATPLNWNTTQADGAKICMEVDGNIDISDLCLGGGGVCRINFFDTTKDCCPVFEAAT